MTERSSRTLSCSVLHLSIAQFDALPPAAQQRSRRALEQRLAAALEPIASRERIVLDAADGSAVIFLGDPRDAIQVAQSVREAAGEPARVDLRMGINLGPVRLTRDAEGNANLFGHGVSVAGSVARLAQPGELLVSRAYYEVSALLRLEHVALCRYAGSRADPESGEQDIYSVGEAPAGTLRRAVAGARRSAAGAWLRGSGPLGLRGSALAVTLAVFITCAAAGVLGRL